MQCLFHTYHRHVMHFLSFPYSMILSVYYHSTNIEIKVNL